MPVGIRILPWLLVVFLWHLVPTLGLVKPGLVPTPLQAGAKRSARPTPKRLA